MACPHCGDLCTCSPEQGISVLIAPDSARSIAVGESATPDEFYRAEADWRTEVSSRLRAHRRRRGFEDDATLSLGFEEPVPAESDWEPPAPRPPAPSRYQRIAMKRRQAQMESGVVIEFPKPATVEMFPDELAEPLPTVPRILEAQEPVLAPVEAPLYATVHLDAVVIDEPFEPVRLELPLQVAPLPPRATSALIDSVLVLSGTALFSMIVLSSAKFVPQGKMALGLVGGVLLFFWAVYHYLFLVYAGTTPGMQMAQLELSSFEGCVPARRTRASRAFALVISCMSLGLGFLSSLFDEDSLGWHDRITRTYLRQS